MPLGRAYEGRMELKAGRRIKVPRAESWIGFILIVKNVCLGEKNKRGRKRF